jgi:predicted MPP superfamily phosphohydrolase
MIAWIIISTLVLALAYYYLGRRLITRGIRDRRRRRIAWWGLTGFFVTVIAAMMLARYREEWNAPLSWISYTLLGPLSFVFTFLVIRDLLLLLGRGAAILTRRRRRSAGATVDIARRDHLVQVSNLAILGAAASLSGYGIYEARRSPGIVHVTTPIARLPKSFEGFRIVQISDLHAGLTIGRDWVEGVVREVEALEPDLIAFTGDMVDGSVEHLRDDVAPLADLKAPHGKFFVTGNHEYYSGVLEWVEEAKRLGYDVLNNEHRLIERGGSTIVLGGVTDHTGGQFLPEHISDPAKAMLGAPADTVRILMAHQPKTIFKTGSLGIDLILSGHTHGGQFFPWNLAAALDQPYIAGLHNHDGTLIYVSRGTGYWGPPVRLAARSEITVITLRG